MTRYNMMDIEELEARGRAMLKREIPKPSWEDAKRLEPLIRELLVTTGSDLKALKKKWSFNGKHSFLFQAFLQLKETGRLEIDEEAEENIRKALMIKPCKSWSGVTSITVFTAPYPQFNDPKTGERVQQAFSCAYNCSFCPNQPGQPRSYILNEPGVLRANKNEFDAARQMWDRMNQLYMIGHQDLAKLEVLVLGGTFTSYPDAYREEFTRDIFYAANTFWERRDERYDIQREQEINRTSRSRVIGLTFETRPDQIHADELRFLRRLGCTRVQLGIQHIDDEVLQKNNRRATHADTVRAIALLKDNCFKIDGHFMPNMPFTTYEKDWDMLIGAFLGLKYPVPRKRAMYDFYDLTERAQEIQVDQIKVYPTAVTPYTQIEEWYKSGAYVPYSNELCNNLVLEFKELVFPWIRINRIVRDFFAEAVMSETGSNLNLRQELTDIMAKNGTSCNCIRCREVKNRAGDHVKTLICIRHYMASGGSEYFISSEAADGRPANGAVYGHPVLYGFVRLRLPNKNNNKTVFPELEGAALIREVHVYSNVMPFDKKKNAANSVQHRGIGTALVQKAEEIASANGFKRMAVIAGIGAQTFYERIGYEVKGEGGFMLKPLLP